MYPNTHHDIAAPETLGPKAHPVHHVVVSPISPAEAQ
jgi:hypothetical protein